MELHIHMTYHQARLPLFGHVVRRLKRNQNNPVHPALKSKKKQFDGKLSNCTLEAKKDIEPLKKQKLDKPSRGISSKNSSAKHNTQMQPLTSDADYMESLFRNMCHQARFPLIGKKVLRLKNDSLPSKSKCNQNSPVNPLTSVPQPSQSTNIDNSLNNSSVMINRASKASNNCSQNPKGKIKFAIKNNSKVRPQCDNVTIQKHKNINKRKNSICEKMNYVNKQPEYIKNIYKSKNEVANNVKTVNVKEETRPKTENFNTILFNNKQVVQVPQVSQLKMEKRPFDDELNKGTTLEDKTEIVQPLKKNKLDLKKFEPNRSVCLNRSSVTVSPVPFDNLNKTSPFDKKKLLDQDITALLKRIRNEVENEILRKSSISSIQDVGIRKKSEETEHGEDKVNLVDKRSSKTGFSNVATQTDPAPEFAKLPILTPMAKTNATQ